MSKTILICKHYLTFFLFLLYSTLMVKLTLTALNINISLYLLPFYLPLLFLGFYIFSKLFEKFSNLLFICVLFMFVLVIPINSFFKNSVLPYNYIGINAGDIRYDKARDTEYTNYKEKYLIKIDSDIDQVLKNLSYKYDDVTTENYIFLETAIILNYDLYYLDNINLNKLTENKFLISSYIIIEHLIESIYYSLVIFIFIIINLLFYKKRLLFGKDFEPLTKLIFPSFNNKDY